MHEVAVQEMAAPHPHRSHSSCPCAASSPDVPGGKCPSLTCSQHQNAEHWEPPVEGPTVLPDLPPPCLSSLVQMQIT